MPSQLGIGRFQEIFRLLTNAQGHTAAAGSWHVNRKLPSPNPFFFPARCFQRFQQHDAARGYIKLQSHFSIGKKGYGFRKVFLQSTDPNDHAVALVGNGETNSRLRCRSSDGTTHVKRKKRYYVVCPHLDLTQQSLRKETKQSLDILFRVCQSILRSFACLKTRIRLGFSSGAPSASVNPCSCLIYTFESYMPLHYSARILKCYYSIRLA